MTALLLSAVLSFASGRPISDFGVRVDASPAANAQALQRAIDWASPRGAALWVEPSEEPYPVDGGVVLRENVSLIGVHGPTGRGTKHPSKPQPVGSVFAIRDRKRPFLTVESATQLRGIQFWYPDQTIDDPAQIVEYPPTLQVSQTKSAQGVTLSNLTFYGESMAMDFFAAASHPCEQVLVEHCYGYPLGGTFLRIGRCYDVPRVLNCHVNPANLRLFRGDYRRAVIDAVVRRKTFAYVLENTDNAQLTNIFTFGTYGGIRLGPATYGQMTGFNFDCVAVGVHKLGDNAFNRNWQVGQGSIIANVGTRPEDTVPILMEGRGHLALTNVEAFSGGNAALTTLGDPAEFLRVEGTERLTVTLVGSRMRNYRNADPVTIKNPRAWVQATACIDKEERPVNRTWGTANGG